VFYVTTLVNIVFFARRVADVLSKIEVFVLHVAKNLCNTVKNAIVVSKMPVKIVVFYELHSKTLVNIVFFARRVADGLSRICVFV